MMPASKRREISEALKTNAIKSIELYSLIEEYFESLEENNNPDNSIFINFIDMSQPYYEEVLDYMKSLGYTVIQKPSLDNNMKEIEGWYDILISW